MHISPQLQWFRSKGLMNNYFLIPQPEMVKDRTLNLKQVARKKAKLKKEEDKNMNFHNWLEMRKIGVSIKL